MQILFDALVYIFINFSEEKAEEESKTCTPEIDDEGYRIQPAGQGQWNVDKGSFFSSSDSGYFYMIYVICTFTKSSYLLITYNLLIY